MSEPLDFRFGNMAIQKGYVTMDQIKECIRIKMDLETTGLDLKLGELLVKKGYMTQQEVDQILRGQTQKAPVQMIAGFELVSKLGEGAMGAVYKAKQVSLDRAVALKILPRRLARNREFVIRFEREARMVAKLSHPNIVRGIDVGQEKGIHYLAMEFIEGESVGQKIARKGYIDRSEATPYILQMASAIEHANQQGVLHRDIKPDNILIETKTGVAKLADLGLARLTERTGATTREMQLTQQGDAIGTPYYCSPEQARGQMELDVRSDLYNLGATFYHMVTGSPPFRGNSAAVVMTKHINDTLEPPASRNSSVDADISAVIVKMMAKNPAGRYQTPVELIADLERLERGEPPLALRAGPVRAARRPTRPRIEPQSPPAAPARSDRRALRPPVARPAPVEAAYAETEPPEQHAALKSLVFLLLVTVVLAVAGLAFYYLGVKGLSWEEFLIRLHLQSPSP